MQIYVHIYMDKDNQGIILNLRFLIHTCRTCSAWAKNYNNKMLVDEIIKQTMEDQKNWKIIGDRLERLCYR